MKTFMKSAAISALAIQSNKQSHVFKKLSMLSLTIVTAATMILHTPAFAQEEVPGRVARVTYSFGSVSFADAGSNTWSELMNNRPISSGDSVFVPERGRAEIHVGSNALRLSENTRVSFVELSDELSQIQLSQGVISIYVRALQEKESFEVNTPNLTFSIQEPGEYRININDDNSTTIIVRSGIGLALGSRDVITIAQGEQSTFRGTNLSHSQIRQAPSMDTFDLWAVDRSRSEENSVSARYVSREVIGYQQLDTYGTWSVSQEYGNVWYPSNVSSQWAPYRDGKWVWVSPWGWTWVDSAPWGFAPYHYGRWAHIHSRWAWIPGRYQHNQRPTYAPALVAFVGNSGNGISVGLGISSGPSRGFDQSVSWFPLGPNEVYRPSYTHNQRYIRNLNQTVINNTTIINGNNNQIYINQTVNNAVTTIPTKSFVRGEYVRPHSSSILSGQVKQLHAITQSPDLQPEKNNRYGDSRRNNMINTNNKGSDTATVYGSGIYAGGNALPITPKPETLNIRNNRPNNGANIGFNNNINNANNSTNNANNANNISTNNATSARFNAEKFDANNVSEITRKNEAYRNTPNNPRAVNSTVSTVPPQAIQQVPQPQQIHTVNRPTSESRNRMYENNNDNMIDKTVQSQQFRPFEAPVSTLREDRAIRAQRERPQEFRTEPRAAAVEMRAPREVPQQAARMEARPQVQEARTEMRVEAPRRQEAEKRVNKKEANVNIE